MSDHQQDERWDKALRAHSPIRTGRLDMASCTIDGEPVRYLYCDAWPERVPISGDYCDYIAYAANRAQPLMERVQALEELIEWILGSLYPSDNKDGLHQMTIRHSLGPNAWLDHVKAQLMKGAF